ncbi:cysteine proteinase [Hymenopellis radicata]|nr:cysteine proteinase [Hymenopellis radicata]
MAKTRPKRSTRSSGNKLVTDPLSSTPLLTSQLRSLGLYAAPTLGDGNCLFRALSDQYYGSEGMHGKVRQDICDWIDAHRERYEGFVDVDEFGKGGMDGYLRGMRQNATYGGHMELSAFAHLTQRHVKVIQPGLVYVISPQPVVKEEEKEAGLEEDPEPRRSSRRRGAEKKEKEKVKVKLEEEDGPSLFGQTEAESGPTLYVAYHDWEHFSSIRNLRGPHAGLPCVVESPGPAPGEDLPPDYGVSKNAKKRQVKAASTKKPRITKIRLKLPEPESSVPPSSVPPSSQASSLAPSSSSSSSSSPYSSSTSSSSPLTPIPSSSKPTPPSSPSPTPSSRATPAPRSSSAARAVPEERWERSPKRTLVEGEEGEERKRRRLREACLDLDAELSELSEEEEETPSLSPDSPGRASTSSSSPEPQPKLTRRQRKKLGLPKQYKLKSPPPRGTGAGVIRIPGGRHPSQVSVRVKQEEMDGEGEWTTNGAGRVDVRGFRELKI